MFNDLSKAELLDLDFLTDIFATDDDVTLGAYINALEDRSRELKCLSQFKRLAKAFESDRKKAQREKVCFERENKSKTEDVAPSFVETTQRGERVNPALLAEYIRQNNKLLNVSGQRENRVLVYRGGVYKPLTDAALQALVKQPVIDYKRSLLNMSDVRKAADDLRTDANCVDEVCLNAEEDIINFKNGLYSLSENKLLPHSEKVLSTIQLPFDYDAAATDCRRTVGYLYSLAGEDNEIFQLLVEIAAVTISNIFGYRFKKAPILFGVGNSGKSQYLLLIQYLLGAENCASGSLADLEARFGTNALYLKRLYGDADLGYTSVDALRVFKSVTGGDSIRIEYKGKDSFSTFYRGMLLFCANELPRFGGDKGDWVYERILPIPCGAAIPLNKRDKYLQDKLRSEAQAFVSSMLLPALDKVVKRNYQFLIPEKCKDALARYQVDNSPVREFFERFCTPGCSVKAKVFLTSFENWYRSEHGGRGSPLSAKAVNRELCAHLQIQLSNLKRHTVDGEYYCFGLNNEGKQFLNKPF